jgi:hypothetical protein
MFIQIDELIFINYFILTIILALYQLEDDINDPLVF